MTHCKKIKRVFFGDNNTLFSEKCKLDSCADLCIKKELGDDDNKKPQWTMLFSRAPVDSDKCITACYFGCANRDPEDDDDKKDWIQHEKLHLHQRN